MVRLYVLYDPKCELCERLRDWLLVQRTWLDCACPAGCEKAQKCFGAGRLPRNDLVVVSDETAGLPEQLSLIMALYALKNIVRGLPPGASHGQPFQWQALK
jgi:hypothetical protein